MYKERLITITVLRTEGVNPLITIVPKGIFPQSYDNRAFKHGFQGISISREEACLAMKLRFLKLNSLNG